MSRACPGGSTGPSRARRSVAREGTARHARGPPVDYLDKPCHPSAFKATGVQFFVSPGVQFRMSFDSGYVSQIVTTTSLIAMVKGRMVKRTRTPAARMNAACNIMRKKTCRSSAATIPVLDSAHTRRGFHGSEAKNAMISMPASRGHWCG